MWSELLVMAEAEGSPADNVAAPLDEVVTRVSVLPLTETVVSSHSVDVRL